MYRQNGLSLYITTIGEGILTSLYTLYISKSSFFKLHYKVVLMAFWKYYLAASFIL